MATRRKDESGAVFLILDGHYHDTTSPTWAARFVKRNGEEEVSFLLSQGSN
jgi:hypothetical protein